MTVMQIDVKRGILAARAAVIRRVVYSLALVTVLGWSFLWLPPMVAGVRAQTELGANGVNGVPSAHSLFELLFVAAHWGVRWLPVVVIAGVAVLATRRLTREA